MTEAHSVTKTIRTPFSSDPYTVTLAYEKSEEGKKRVIKLLEGSRDIRHAHWWTALMITANLALDAGVPHKALGKALKDIPDLGDGAFHDDEGQHMSVVAKLGKILEKF